MSEPMTDAVAPPELVSATFRALDVLADGVGSQCRVITETLDALGDALGVLTGTPGGGAQGYGGFGIIGLPILGAMRAAKSLAGQYVKQQTGVPLSTWTDFVESSSSVFESYLTDLGAVAQRSGRYPGHQSTVDPESAPQDIDALMELRWKTQAWKSVLQRIAQLGAVVEAILATDLSSLEAAGAPAATDDPPSFAGTLQRRLKEVQTKALDRTTDMREWVLRPFVEIRDRVQQLPTQVEVLSRDVALLEILLELEVASLRAAIGLIPAQEAAVVSLRVSAAVVIPALAVDLREATARVETCRTWLVRLEDGARSGAVSPDIQQTLDDRYRGLLSAAEGQAGDLELHAETWRRNGPGIVDACVAWTNRELELLTARQQIEGPAVDADRRVLLVREQQRLGEARQLLATL